MRSLFLPLPLLLAPLAAPTLFTSPVEAAILPSCCVAEGGSRPDDRDPEEEPPLLVGAKVRSPEERDLEASAEAPITADAPTVNAIGIPLYPVEEDRRGVSEPERVTVPILAATPSLPQGEDLDIETTPCCQPAIEREDPPKVPVGAKVTNPDERALQTAAEAQIEKATQLVKAIGIPLYPLDEDRRGISEPRRTPAEDADETPATADGLGRWLDAVRANAEAILLALLLAVAISFAISARRRRSRSDREPFPWPRPMPGEPSRRDTAFVPRFEPEVVRAKARQAEREQQPA